MDICRFYFVLAIAFNLHSGFYNPLRAGTENQITDCSQMHDSLYNLADEYYYIDMKKSLGYSYDLLDLAKLCNEDAIYLSAYESLGWAYLSTSDFPESVRFSEKALDIALKLGDSDKLINIYNLLGNIYIELPDKDYALEYFNKGIAVATSIGDEDQLASLYNNVAIVYEMFEERRLALTYYHKAKMIFEKKDVASDKGLIYLNIGDSYFYLNQYDSASYYFELSRSYLDPEEDQTLLSLLFLCMSSDASNRNNFNLAVKYLDSSYVFLSEANSPTDYIQYYRERADIMFKHGKYQEGYVALEKAYTLKDSVLSNEVSKKLREVQISTLAERKEAEIEKLMQQNEIQDLKLSENKATQKSYLLIISLVAIVSCFFIFVAINHRRNHKKLKVRSQIIEEQSVELNKKNTQLVQINKEILDSIVYAKRIQNAILPSDKTVKELLPDSFILFKPKDIVAGDFYWIETHGQSAVGSMQSKIENEGILPTASCILFAAADCTGHGVPGAMVSVICNNGLNRSVREHGITSPGKILEKTREIVIQEFEKSDDDVKDGMDISLCALSLSNLTLEWAGANNPLWIIREGKIQLSDISGLSEKTASVLYFDDFNCTLAEIKADKQPIGKHTNAKPFTTHKISLKKGDLIYIPTDGFQDQFGGDKGKKFKASNLKSLLASVHHQSMSKQKEVLDNALEVWRGALEQVDDVCVIGVRL